MVVRWRRVTETRGFREARIVLCAGLLVLAVLVLAGPLVMAGLVGTALPWDRLADIGEAFGGISAVLSAVALCGVGASLLYQQRQTRQELADIERQHHMELMRMAIENPGLMEVLDVKAADSPHWKQETYANLTMMYWLTIWELGEIDDEELRSMTSSMFESPISLQWWARVREEWIGTHARPRRRRFLAIVNSEFESAESVRRVQPRPPVPAIGASMQGYVLVGVAAIGLGYLCGRRIAPVRRPVRKERQDSAG
ncbi:hypothetical protein Aph02nite_26360 [Actinoplanes philippinensis]|uniref:Uncharacterized protein n=1 Tax=Actinoplanes philippinensis TaxID=35752 RepID=A0A1I2G907_9ACTN|nr:DUF6082 family protein [Actinoplanes philippinensis]GIE76686.1 hypothetical protein Aph02nite_26360 [Actinoplanes philippinensis]SFF13460.1 hypothetical protein SAMN05421541_106294 [Actinoplanes philippinensis]